MKKASESMNAFISKYIDDNMRRPLAILFLILAALTALAIFLYWDLWVKYMPLVLLAAIGAVLYWLNLKQRIKEVQQRKEKVLYTTLLCCLFQAALDLAGKLPFDTPIDSTDLMIDKAFYTYQNMPVSPMALPKLNPAPLDSQQKDMIKLRLSTRMKNNIHAGNIPNIPLPDINGVCFLPRVHEVLDAGATLLIFVAWENDYILYNQPYHEPTISTMGGSF